MWLSAVIDRRHDIIHMMATRFISILDFPVLSYNGSLLLSCIDKLAPSLVVFKSHVSPTRQLPVLSLPKLKTRRISAYGNVSPRKSCVFPPFLFIATGDHCQALLHIPPCVVSTRSCGGEDGLLQSASVCLLARREQLAATSSGIAGWCTIWLKEYLYSAMNACVSSWKSTSALG